MNFAATVCAIALAAYMVLLVLVGRNARRPESRAFFMFLLAMTLWQASYAVVTFTDSREIALAWWRMAFGLASGIGLFYAVFARRTVGIQSHPWLMRVGLAIAVAIFGWTLLGGGHVVDDVYWDERSTFWLPNLGVLGYAMTLYVYGFLAYGLFCLVRNYRITNSALARNRLRYLIIGVSIVFAGLTSNLSDALKVYPVDVIANVLNAMLIAYAILRYHLLDISVVARKGLLYSVPAIFITALYLFAVYLASSVFHLVTGYQVVLLSLVMALLTAVALQPFWALLQSRVDRLFFREKYDATQLVKRLSRKVASILDLEQLGDIILNEITVTLHITNGAMLLKEKGTQEFRLVASIGLEDTGEVRLGAGNPIAEWLARNMDTLSRHDIDVMPQFQSLWTEEVNALARLDAELFVPLLVQDELVGILVLGPKRSEVSYTDDEQGMLLTLASQTAMAVQNAWLYQVAVEEKERTEVIVRRAFAGIMVVDNEMNVLSLNPGAEGITGYRSKDLVGKPLPAMFEPAILAEGAPLRRRAAHSEAANPVETVLHSKEGARDILLAVTRISDGYLLNFADITRLKEVDRLKSNIVANVSHELRTPLASIKGYADFLLEGYGHQDEELQRRFLTIINDEADRLAGFINDLLDLARLESGRIEPRLEDVDFEEVIGDVIEVLEIQARRAGITIQVVVAHELPHLNGNQDLLNSVVKNLVGNAIKYSPDGGRVDVVATVADGGIVFTVADQGIGIPPAELPYLFSKFYRSGAARDSGIRGTGLGLVLAKEAVLAHRGTITVESDVGRGTRFTVTLPVQSGSNAGEAPAPEEANDFWDFAEGVPQAGSGADVASPAEAVH